MKKGLMILGGIFAAILILITMCAVPEIINGQALDKESKAYADNLIQVLGVNWDEAELEKRGSPEFFNAIAANPNGLKTLFTACQNKLGKLTSYKGATGSSNVSIMNGHRTVTAAYVATAMFEKGYAKIRLKLIKHDNQWQVSGIYIESDALMR